MLSMAVKAATKDKSTKKAPAKKSTAKTAKAEKENKTTKKASKKEVAGIIANLLKGAKDKGFITLDEINTALPKELVTPEAIETIIATLTESGISVTEKDEVLEEDSVGQETEHQNEAAETAA